MGKTGEAAERESGSVLLITLILMVTFGGLVSASLSMMVSENRKLSKLHLANQVQLRATAQMEIAKNIVNAAKYDVYMNNLALGNALSQPNNLIPNTDVEVRRVGTSQYYVLRTLAHAHGITKQAESIVRQTSPASSNNLMVLDHPVGLSGSPRGAIHTNKWIDFYFGGSKFVDQVTASEGFNFVAGATQDNTAFAGPVNSHAPTSNPLENIDFDALWAEADLLAVKDDLISEVEFKGDKAEIKLYTPAHTIEVPVTKTERVYSHSVPETYIVSEPIKETYTYTETVQLYRDESYVVVESQPIYKWRDATREIREPILEAQLVSYEVDVPVYSTRTVQVTKQVDVWVPYTGDGSSSSGGTVGSTSTAAGYWKRVNVTEDVEESYISGFKKETRTRTDMVKVGENVRIETYSERYIDSFQDVNVTLWRKVPDGTKDVLKTGERIIGYQDVEKTRMVKVYVDQTTTVMKTVTVDEALTRTETIPLNGTIYLKGDVRKISGDIQGRLSLITSGKVNVTGNLRYVDPQGETRMLSGSDMTKPYEENPDYKGDSLLAIMAKGDILYDRNAPKQLEINASMISYESVKFDGIEVSADGTSVWTSGSRVVLESLRRLGGVVSRLRPIATFIDESGFIAAGFEAGESIMDQNLILSSGNNSPPPFMFESARPTWIMDTAGIGLGVVQ